MSSLITKCKNLEIKNVVIPKIVADAKKKPKFLPIYYVSKNGHTGPLLVKTPKMTSSFGAGCYNKQENVAAGNKLKYGIQLRLSTTNKKLSKLKDFLEDLDRKIVETIADSSGWLELLKIRTKNKRTGEPMSRELLIDVLEQSYTPLVKHQANPIYDPTVNVKFDRDFRNGEYVTCVSAEGSYINLTDENIEELFCKGIDVRTIIKISHIWMVSGRFGITLKLVNGKLYQPKVIIPMILSSSDEEEEEHQEYEDIPQEKNPGEKYSSSE